MMSRPGSTLQSSAATPALSASPPPSESFQSDLDGASLLDGGATEYGFDSSRLREGSGLNLVSWRLDVNARSEDGVEKRGFNGGYTLERVQGNLTSSYLDCTESPYKEGGPAERVTETSTTYWEPTSTTQTASAKSLRRVSSSCHSSVR